jgi:dTDP-4-amino-4,6-dideoxygalactose transaminase
MNDTTLIPLNRPGIVGRELEYIEQALRSDHRQGAGRFTQRCQEWLEQWIGRQSRVFLTQSCTSALEMAALLIDLKQGDEIVMPSYTFVSTANAFVLRGAVPVFVDIDPATQNISPQCVERALTPRTRAIVAVHYGGVGCDMDNLCGLASRHNLILIEDAAQALLARRAGRPLGSFGNIAAFSFHDSKNISCGEGGALVLNDPAFVKRAEILWEKGTNRSQFLRREADKYAWLDVGSSFLPGEITAAFLLAQLEKAKEITIARQKIWTFYHDKFDRVGAVAHLPAPPSDCVVNGHIYYLVLPGRMFRDAFIEGMRAHGIMTPFHYVPLHSSPGGQRFGRVLEKLRHTDAAGDGLVRLPLFPSMSEHEMMRVVRCAIKLLQSLDCEFNNQHYNSASNQNA